MGVGFGQSTAISNPMRMSIVRSFLWLECGRAIAYAGTRPSRVTGADSGQRVPGRIYQLHKLGDTRVNPSTSDRIQQGFPIAAVFGAAVFVWHVRFGSGTEIRRFGFYVCYTPVNGHRDWHVR